MKTIHVLAVGSNKFWGEQQRYFPPEVHLSGPYVDKDPLLTHLHRAAVNATLPDVMLVEASRHQILDDAELASLIEQFSLPVIIVNREGEDFEPEGNMALSMPITATNFRHAVECALRLRRLNEENKLLREAMCKGGAPHGGRLERRVFGEQYREAKRLYRLMVATIQQTREGVVLVNPRGIIEYVNGAFESCTGIKRRQLIGKHMKKCSGGRFASSLLLGVRKTAVAREPWHGKIRIGSNLFDLYVGEIRDSARRLVGYAGIFFDITIKDEMEQRLIEAQRLESLGTFAGGIAHDFNNIIQAIQANVGVIRELFPDLRGHEKFLSRIGGACDRADGLVKKFLNFSRNREDELVPVAIEPVIREVLELLQPEIPKNIGITVMAEPDASPVTANPHGIYEIVLNLVKNAVDVFKTSPGSIGIRVCDEIVAPGNPFNLPAGHYVNMCVTDSGEGIPAEVTARIFEPFFSTKKSGYGRGLGLAVVHGIVNSLHGHIGVRSTPGQGTEFYIYLPVQEAVAPNGLNEHVLLVGEIPAVTEELRQIISSVGCLVTTVRTADEALRLFASEPLRFDMIVSEKICRDGLNQDMFERIFALRETIPAIYITDYSHPIDIGVGALNRVVMLMRPFAPDVLAQAVRALFRYRNNSPVMLSH